MTDTMMLPLGEVVTWMSKATTHAALVAGLSKAGLDPALARDMLPRNAFSRALKKMEQNRVIRQISEDKTDIYFQFTKEAKRDGEFVYDLEAKLRLCKRDGEVECLDKSLQSIAAARLAECMDARTASDVTSIVQRVLKGKGDLFPINPNGGSYFVPAAYRGLIDQVQVFLGEIGGAMPRFAVSQGDKATETSVRTSMRDGMLAAIAEYRAAVEAMDMDTRPDTIKRSADRIKAAKFKLESYKALLGEDTITVETALSELGKELKAKVTLIGKTMPVEVVLGKPAASAAPPTFSTSPAYTPPAMAHVHAGEAPAKLTAKTVPLVITSTGW